MSPINARIFLAEDNKKTRVNIKDRLEGTGHQIVFEASDVLSAMEGAKKAVQLGVDVGIIDGNLSENDESCNDGHEIASALREQVPGIRIIAYSVASREAASYGDVYV